MKVFVTGATGFIGSAVVKELIGAGHQVLGLARNDDAANKLAAAGAEVHRGDLEDIESLKAGVAASDGVIHLGFIHDFSRFKEVCETDRLAITAMGTALAGTQHPFIVTSGTALIAHGGIATEDKIPPAGSFPRVASEQAVDAVAAMGVRASVVRLSPSVHGVGEKGFVPIVINLARQNGVSVYAGEGQNRWPAVHRLDAAKLYRLALEKNADGGTRFHGVAEEGVAFKDIAEIIGKRLGVPVISKSPEEAAKHFEWFSHFALLDNRASSKKTQEFLGWKPTQPGLLEDIDQESYFAV
jgi:nucleoside-diphosphate-sugar epimerase